MKTYILVICAALVISASAQAQDQAGVQGNAAAGSQTSVSAKEGEATATSSGTGSANAGTKQADASLTGGTELTATLNKPVDASKNRPGDEVTATTAQDVKSAGQVVIPRGSKLIGRVTKAQHRSKGGSAGGSAESQLGVVFERAVLKDGREIPLNATVQAVAAARSAASAGVNTMDARMAGAGGAAASGGAAGGGVLGGVTGTATGSVGTVAGAGGAMSSTVVGGAVSKSASAIGGLNTAGRLTSGSKGVFGLEGLDVTSAAASSGEGSVITSKSRNVRLDGGTQMLLVTSANAAGSAGAVSGPNSAGSLSGAANAAGSVSGAAKKTGDSGADKDAEKVQPPPDAADKR